MSYQPKNSRLVVLISGNGSNLQALIDACASHELPAEIIAVISNKADAFGLGRARNASITTKIMTQQATQTRQEYDAALATTVASLNPDWVILAGWMRLLSPVFLDHFQNRVLNLHPALPNTFPGLHAIERALAAYQSGDIAKTGVMVHRVDNSVDAGEVLATADVAIMQNDTIESLSERIHKVEHQILVETIKKQILQCHSEK